MTTFQKDSHMTTFQEDSHMTILHHSEHNHQLDNSSSTEKVSSTAKTNILSKRNLKECCQERGLNLEWIKVNCKSVDIKEATEYLGYQAKSPGILIEGANGQYQFKPNKPWSDKQGKKAPKYRTAAGDQYDALLPAHPTDKFYWLNIEALKERCYKINDVPMLLVTEGGFKAISACSHDIPTIALLGVEMGLTSSKDDPQGKRYLISELERFAKLGFGFIFAFDADTYTKKQVKQALIKLARQIQKFEVPVYNLPQWNESEGKGIDDYIQKQGIEAFRKQLLSQAIDFDRWYDEYGSDAFGEESRKTVEELLNYVRNKYKDRLRLNKLQQKIELDGVEFLVERAYLFLADHDKINCSKTIAADVFTLVAEENVYSPVIVYLNTVAEQIPPISLDNLSQRYFGTSNPIYDIFLKRTLIAAVARAYQPGCKHDTTLVLQGAQGIGKSTFFNVLGGDWFDDSMGNGNNKDDLIILHKSWIQEWGEIERTFSKKQSEELKAFITRQKDIFRPPYGRSALEFSRQSIIVGTANSTEFLVDSTGNRRYWIIPAGKEKIDVKRLRDERDKIWSAAVKAYRNGEKWWLTSEEEKLSNQNNQKFQIVDEWQGEIADYLEFKDKVSISEILTKVFEIEPGKIDRRSQMRVGNILTTLNWQKIGQQKYRGKRQTIWKPSIPQKEGGAEVLQAKNQTQQGLSVSTIPTISNEEISQNSNNFSTQCDNLPTVTHRDEVVSQKLEKKVHSGIVGIENKDRVRDTECNTSNNTPAIPQKKINWQTYPYNSSDRTHLENRALKVKERILGCTTSNELNKLLFSSKATELELNWLIENCFTEAEKKQLQQIQSSTQGNLFSEQITHGTVDAQNTFVSSPKPQSEVEVIEIDFNDIKADIDALMKRKGWTTEQGRQYLIDTYNKKSRLHLTDEELLEFWDYLKTLEEGCGNV